MTGRRWVLGGLMMSIVLVGCAGGGGVDDVRSFSAFRDLSGNHWYVAGQATVSAAAAQPINKDEAKNIILFIGDGMGLSTVTAARILDGQLRGMTGEENQLSFETLPYTALAKTYNTNQQTPDSAGTMTAIMTGVKSKAGVIAVTEEVVRGDCRSVAGNELVSALVLAEVAGKATGVVTTARLTHATPAATYAVSPERGWEDDSKLPAGVSCKDIATQLIEFPYGDGIEVALGGGRRHFLPEEVVDGEGKKGRRKDGVDLTARWRSELSNAAYVWNRDQFLAVDVETTDHLLGLFDSSHMAYEVEREEDRGGEPSLAQMTAKAIDMLSKDEDGFFLMVESGRIDHGHHAGNAYRALTDTIAFSEAVEVALEKTDERETLIIVTADHSHVFTIAGYPVRGNPILGLVRGNRGNGEPALSESLDANGLPYTTLGYTNGPGVGEWRDEVYTAGERADLHDHDTQARDFRQESRVPLSSETHGAEDVAVYARGPGAYLVRSTLEQNAIFHIMDRSARLVDSAKAAFGQTKKGLPEQEAP